MTVPSRVSQGSASVGDAKPPFLVSARGVALCVVLVAATAALFAAAPGLDLATAAWFYRGDGAFVGHGRWGDALRRLFSWAPFVVLALYALAYALRRAHMPVPWSPTGRGVLFLGLSLLAGPGLLVNTVLKDHSHRPRPVQVTDFGGDLPFRPFYRFDGACARNCSFVSGEGSLAFWCAAPALLVPPGLRALALAGALAFGAATNVLRMAFGGHFLSDVLLAALFTWLVVAAAWRVTMGPFRATAHRPGPPRRG